MRLRYIHMSYNKYEDGQGMAGCYSMPNSSNPPLELPLKSFSYGIEIVDCFTQVLMTQLYLNPTERPLDVQYIFPVHPGASVTRLEVEFGGKRSQGVVMEKQAAKKEFAEKVKEGGGAALGEYNPLSRDIMKMQVGNIAPRQTVKILLTYVHTNSLVCNTFYQYKLTSTMTPRYAHGLQVPQLVFNSFPGSKSIEGRCEWSVNVSIRSSQKILKVESQTHKMKITQNGGCVNATFANNELPNKDFTLSYTLQNYSKPLYSISHSDNSTTAAISFIPKYCSITIDDAYKQHLSGKSFEVDLDANKGEYIFLLDRSGSMDGLRIENAKRAMEIFLRSLPEDSYFNVLSFGNSFKYLFPESPKNTKASIQLAVGKINEMQADLGGTEILGAIKNLVRREVIPGYPRQLFFLTDGTVGNVNEVLRFISKHTQYTRINSIGIGNGCSEQLIRGCAKRGKGYSIFIEDEEQKPEQKIISLLENTLSPVISNLQLEYSNKAKVESIVPNPQKTPFILKNDLANFYISFNGKLTEPFKVTIKYVDSLGKAYREEVVINPNAEGVQCDWLHNLVNYQKIQALLDTYEYGQSQQDRIFYVKKLDKESLRKDIIQLSVKHQILTEITAFLCIDAHAADQIKKFNINNPKEKLNIQGMNPYDHVVNFVNEGERDDEDEGYIDECCMMECQMPPSELKKIAKFQEFTKIHRPLPFQARIAGQVPGQKAFDGITCYPDPHKRLAYAYVIKKQQVNGSWTEDFLDSLFPNSKELRSAFEVITDKTSFLTFLVCQYLLRFHPKEGQFAMIIKKGRNYVDKNSKKKWRQLEEAFLSFYYPLKE